MVELALKEYKKLALEMVLQLIGPYGVSNSQL